MAALDASIDRFLFQEKVSTVIMDAYMKDLSVYQERKRLERQKKDQERLR